MSFEGRLYFGYHDKLALNQSFLSNRFLVLYLPLSKSSITDFSDFIDRYSFIKELKIS